MMHIIRVALLAATFSLWGGGERSFAQAEHEFKGYWIAGAKVCASRPNIEVWLHMMYRKVEASVRPAGCEVMVGTDGQPFLVFIKKLDTIRVGTRLVDIYEVRVPMSTQSYARFYAYLNLKELI